MDENRRKSRSGIIMAKRSPHTGSGFDDFLKDEGVYEEIQAKALKRVLAEQLEDGMQATQLTKVSIAKKMERNEP